MSVNLAHMQNLVGGPKGVSSGRRGEVDTFYAFLFLVPRALLQLTMKLSAQYTKIRVSVVGIFLLRQLVSRLYRPPFLPQKPPFPGPASYLL